MALAVENALGKIMVSDIGVTDLVSTNIGPHLMEQDTELPYIRYARVSGTHEHHMEGASGLAMARVQIDAIAATYNAVKNLADKIRLAIDGFVGVVTVGGDTVTIQSCFLAEHRDAYDNPVDGSDTGIPRVIMDWNVWYGEVKPVFE